MISPASGFSLPAIMRKSVDLPAPFGPMIPTIAPAGIVKVDVVHQQPVAVGFAHARELDHPIAQPLGDRE